MNKDQAYRLIRETFESPFDKDRFTYFIKNLLNRIEDAPLNYFGQYLPLSYREYISSMQRIGKYNDGEKDIDILVIKLKKETSLERARSMQRNYVAWYLNGSRGGQYKDAALVAYVSPDSEEWRFSLVKMDYTFEQTPSGRVKVKQEFTPARRWSFLVGTGERSHTAQQQLVKILQNDEHNPNLAELEEAFNIEPVSREFFDKYRDLFIRTKEALDQVLENDPAVRQEFEDKGVDTVNFSKKLLGQIVFLYFLQKKGWFGVKRDELWGSGSRHFLRELFEKKHGGYDNFFNDILEPLFYEALRQDRSHDDHYYSRFRCKIPFLNGGLFDPIGDYQWYKTDILLPNSLFSNDIKTKEGDVGNGILDIFDRYNFTVKEDEPLEKDVAIDPELLGKTYEKFNAIRPDNFEEYQQALRSGKKGSENKFNKQYGVYYTPREIVHYMCQQSLINYLDSELAEEDCKPPVRREHLEKLIHLGEHVSERERIALDREQKIKKGKIQGTTYEFLLDESIRENASIIDRKLADITVCDPAVGSGAFLVGMMSEILRTRQVLSSYFRKEGRHPYNFKRRCIEYSLYGVDIDPGAVEIAKLRLWLSLVVDEGGSSAPRQQAGDTYSIKPLPNLEYKVYCGNSLIGLKETPDSRSESTVRIERLKQELINETNPTRKKELKEQIDENIRKKFENYQQAHGYRVDFDFRLIFSEVFHQPAPQNEASSKAGNTSGFDVVIGNPPYIQLQKLRGTQLQKDYKNQDFEVHNPTGDIYCLFYEKGLQILHDGGILCFITSNKWMRAGYGEKLRSYLSRLYPLLILDLGPGVFDTATVDTNILVIKKCIKEGPLRAAVIDRTGRNSTELSEYVKEKSVFLNELGKDTWFISSPAEYKLKKKMEEIGKPLKEWDVKINYGIKTGLNKAFIIDTPTRDRLIAEDPKGEEIIKPILRGRDIKQYAYKWAGLWIIIAKFGSYKYLPEKYPVVYKHLLQFKEKLENRGQCKYTRSGKENKDYAGQHHWLELDNNPDDKYLQSFEKEKVVWKEMAHKPTFFYDDNYYFCNDTARILTGSNLQFFVGVFNSSTFFYAFSRFFSGGGLGEKGVRFKSEFMKEFPIPPINNQNRPIVDKIESLVDKILAIKKDNINANTADLESEIDQLVYQLYDLTPEEIRIVEILDK